MNKKERRLNEFCDIGNLEDYKEILQAIFNKIDDANCSISARDDRGPAIHEFPNERGSCHIRIPLKTFTNNPIEGIWVILHEFGHHQSGRIDKKQFTKDIIFQREKEAWNFAREELLLFPKLANDILEFNKYAQKCLESYRTNLTATE